MLCRKSSSSSSSANVTLNKSSNSLGLLQHLFQCIAARGAPDPKFCYPAGSGILDTWRIGPDPDPNLTTGEKLLFLQHSWKKLEWLFTLFCDWISTWVIINVWHELYWTEMTELLSFHIQFCVSCVIWWNERSCDIYRILPQIRPDPDTLDPSQIHQIHRISGRIRIQCTPNCCVLLHLPKCLTLIIVQMCS